MPKIIENARGLIIDEAKRQIEENGYETATIRSIAKGCRIGLGTFYNYFKSKDVLIATYLLEEWEKILVRINDLAEIENDSLRILEIIHNELNLFMKNNAAVFMSDGAKKSFQLTVGGYHKRLVKQLSEPIFKVLERNGYENAEFLSLFVSEAILTWTVDKKSFDELAPVMSKLFVK